MKKDKMNDSLENDKKDNKKIKESEFKKIVEENAILNDKLLRTNADIVNMKRRYDEEISRILKFEGESFIKELLPVVDNFERAISLDDNNLSDELSKFLSGFKMIYGSLVSIMKENDVVEIEALGEYFDPHTMNAVMTDKVIEEESNIVLDVMQKGYIYKDKVIRPAMVKVNE